MADSEYSSIIWLTQGKYAIVDNDGAEELRKYKWHVTWNNYATRKTMDNFIITIYWMHRVINNTPQGFETDHINRNKLDNRRSNLRTCTRSQNNMNKLSRRNSSSKYKGVGWFKRDSNWRVQLVINGKNTTCGYFGKEEDAARRYDELALQHYGEWARLNFPKTSSIALT